MTPKLVLSLFPGVGLLDSQFEAEGFCVVRGPDLIWGGNVRAFSPPAGVFDGIIGGPPCQDFSAARRDPPTGDGVAMLQQWCRIVDEAQPHWWLMENVPRVPDVAIDGYQVQRIDVDNAWFAQTRRARVIQFGASQDDGCRVTPLDIPRGEVSPTAEPAALASDERTFSELCRLQGLPAEFELPGMTDEGRKRAVGNGVPVPLGRILARAVLAAAYGESVSGPLPDCDAPKRCVVCQRVVTGRRLTCSDRCRKERSRRTQESRRRVTADRLPRLRVDRLSPDVTSRVPQCDRAREVQTRWGGTRIEHLWHNFDPQTAAGWSWQDPEIGFRERQRISRKAQRWARMLREMTHTERAAVVAEVLNAARDAAVGEL